jgi:predicted metal-dependent hydrolase
MRSRIQLGDIVVDVTLKDVKNVHLSVHPPAGRVTVAAPARMSLEAIRTFVITKLGWIKRQQKKLRDQERETPRELLNRESHYVWGKRYLLKVVEGDSRQTVDVLPTQIVMRVSEGTTPERKQALLADWYRAQVKAAVPCIIEEWEPRIGATVNKIHVQQMKTKWGSCNPYAGSIRLNTELAKKPKECLEYVVVHEMMHLLEPTHNARFVALMDRIMPNWRILRDQLNQLPVGHVKWKCS